MTEATKPRREEAPGAVIQRRRESLGLSQSQFAAALGVSVRTLQGWEQGRRTPRLSGMIERAIAALEGEHVNTGSE